MWFQSGSRLQEDGAYRVKMCEYKDDYIHEWSDLFSARRRRKTSVFSLSSFIVLREHLDVASVLTPIPHTAEVISTLS
jgi:hypothetical protein